MRRLKSPWRCPAAAVMLTLALVHLVMAGLCYSTGTAYAQSGTCTKTEKHSSRKLLSRSILRGALLAPVPGLAEALPVGGERVKLNNGLTFPKASFGLQVYDDSTAQSLTELALSLGYRNFFASVLAGNQRGFARAVAASGMRREDIFICGSVVSTVTGFEEAYSATKNGCRDNLEAFSAGGITYLDMIMLDYPAGDCESIRGQWKAFEEMLAAGTTKSLAVSNFSPAQLDCIADKAATVPAVNQLPFSVYSNDVEALAENQRRGILVQAWSPLGGKSMAWPSLGLAATGACEAIGKKHGKSAAQVALRWILQRGATFTTQTQSKAHFVEDLDIFDFELTETEMKELDSISVSAGAKVDGVMKVAAPGAAAAVLATGASRLLRQLRRPGR